MLFSSNFDYFNREKGEESIVVKDSESFGLEFSWNITEQLTNSEIERLREMLQEKDSPKESEDTDFEDIMNLCYQTSVDGGWWHDLETGKPLDRNKGEMLALIHSEISEAMEGARKGLMDDHLPHRPMEEVEMADAVIRIMDYCRGFDLDLLGALLEKVEYNKQRADHKVENRKKEGGKKF